MASGRGMGLLGTLLMACLAASARGQDSYHPVTPPAPAPQLSDSYNPTVQQQAASTGSAWPPPGEDVRRGYESQRQDFLAAPAQAASTPVPVVVPVERLSESTWYFRQDAYYWNERIGGADFVNEYGPLSTLGYQHRFGIERIRLEVFGGTVAYDGAAQYEDGTTEPYHDSFGTSYVGCRGEYDLLIEPASWTYLRGVVGIGTRFWVRDLKSTFTPSGNPVIGYQETWWTIYPYVGLETKESQEAGPKFFGSVRFGLTPFTYQYATYFDNVLYPHCGVTAQTELGVRFQRFSTSLFLEAMTWGRSGIVADAYGDESYQPDSRMLTIGAKLSYTF